MFCGNCGFTNSATAKFCNQCGRALSGSVQPAPSLLCNSCGAEVRADRQFCGVCGQSVVSSRPAPPPASASPVAAEAGIANQFAPAANDTGKSTGGQKFSLSAAIVALICFFLPWVEVSCRELGAKVTLSGYDLATAPGGRGWDLGATLWLLPAGMIVAIALVLIQMSRERGQRQPEKGFSAGVIMAGALSLASMVFLYLKFRMELAESRRNDVLGLTDAVESMIQFQFGAFVSLLGSAAVSIGGILHLNSGKRPMAHSPPETPRVVNAPGAPGNAAPAAAPVAFSPLPAHSQPQVQQCRSCGARMRPMARFCGSCGARV